MSFNLITKITNYLIGITHFDLHTTTFMLPFLPQTMIIPPQAAYLYYGNWTAEVDEIVLTTIIKLKGATRWTLPDFPNWFLLTAQQEVRTNLDIHFTEAEIKQRLDFMKLRFETFNSTLGEGASWDVGAAYVRANDNLWMAILHVLFLTIMYYVYDL